jgi:hypothetical protein
MLDYCGFSQPGWQEQPALSVPTGPNAALLPFSDNDSGKVYVAVVALRDITAGSGEDICIDYGESYWEVVREQDSCNQIAELKVGMVWVG